MNYFQDSSMVKIFLCFKFSEKFFILIFFSRITVHPSASYRPALICRTMSRFLVYLKEFQAWNLCKSFENIDISCCFLLQNLKLFRIFVAKQLVSLKSVIEDLIPLSKKGFIQQFYAHVTPFLKYYSSCFFIFLRRSIVFRRLTLPQNYVDPSTAQFRRNL